MTPEIILGPPGTGKTTTLLRMVEEELTSGTAPDRIGYFSFTKRAATEAVERACKKFSLDRRQLRYFRTLHSMCFQALGMSNSDVLEGKKLREFGDWIGVRVSEFRSMDDTAMFGFSDGDRALFMENLSRVMRMPLRQLYDRDSDDLSWVMVDRVARGLSEFKRAHSLVDYTDMLQMFVDAEWSPRLEVLFVDEAQDLSRLQWDVVWKLAQSARRVVIAGDDDQAIYRWAGAAVDYFIQLSGQTRVLGQSWRVPPPVQSLSHDIIGRVRQRREKEWSPADKEGSLEFVHDEDEVDWRGEDDVLVLARNSYILKNLTEYLKREGVIYEHRGHPSVRRSVLDSVRIWERLRRGETATVDEVRTVYQLMSSGRGVKRGYKTLPSLAPDQSVDMSFLRDSGGLLIDTIWHEALDRVAEEERLYMVRALRSGEKLTGRPRVRLSTIHGAKGGESDHVVLYRDMAQRTHAEYRLQPEDEARVWYVAVTRAQRRLSVLTPRTRMNYPLYN